MTKEEFKKFADDGLATVSDYRKFGYRSRNNIVDVTGLQLRYGKYPPIFDKPDAIVNGVHLYSHLRAERIIFELSDGSYFNKMAFKFITGQFQPQ